MNVVVLESRFSTLSVKCSTVNFCIQASKGPVIFIHQLKSLYKSPFNNSYSHPIHTCLAMIASNELPFCYIYFIQCLIPATPCNIDNDCSGTPGTTCVADYCQSDVCNSTGQCVHGQICSHDVNRRCVCEYGSKTNSLVG